MLCVCSSSSIDCHVVTHPADSPPNAWTDARVSVRAANVTAAATTTAPLQRVERFHLNGSIQPPSVARHANTPSCLGRCVESHYRPLAGHGEMATACASVVCLGASAARQGVSPRAAN